MKHIFIINPMAGKGKSLEVIPYIKQCFEDSTDEVIIKSTEYPGHATEIAKKYSSTEKCRIYSVGGDGTLNEIVNGMAGTKSVLGILPTGSGNDFIRNFKTCKNIKDTILSTVKGLEKTIDLGKVNNKYFINIASIGFDAEVVYNADKFKKISGISGSMAYLISIVYTVFKRKICEVDIDIDDIYMRKKLLFAAVANGRYYGGGIIPTPDAEIDDGLFDVCMVREISRFRLLMLFPKYVKGKHAKLEQVSFYKCKNVKIESQNDICLNIDGEIMTAKSIEFGIIENAMNVIVPQICT